MRRALQAFFQAKIRPWELAAVAGWLLCFFSLAGFAGRSWWMLDLASHFRVQYVVLLFLLSALFLIQSRAARRGGDQATPRKSDDTRSPRPSPTSGRREVVSAVFALFALFNCAVVVPQCWGTIPKSDVRGAALRVMLMNVHRENQHSELAIQRIRENDPDLIVLEEMDERWWSALSALRQTYRYDHSDRREDDFGIALMSKRPLQNATNIYLGSAEVPSVTAQVEVGGTFVTVVGTHPVPPAGSEGTRLRNEQLSAVAEFIRPVNGPKIVLGDLNTTPWNHAFRQLLDETALIDSSRGLGYQATWPAFFWPMGIPLDHCLVSSEIKTIRRRVGQNIGSDHFPIIVDLIIKTNGAIGFR